MKWAVIGLIAVVVLGAGGYAIYRWTDVPEQAKEWMDEQDLKNFPAQAQREVDGLKKNLDEYKASQKELKVDIVKREGRETWTAADNEGTVLGYTAQVKKYEDAIKDIVKQVKAEREQLVAAGTVDADTGKVPASHEYSITNASGKSIKWTEARAREETDKMAAEVDKINRKKERQQRIIDAKKQYVGKLDNAVERLAKKIEEMEEFIEDMKTELELLKIEEDIAAINASINGEDDSNRFGAAVRKFRDKKKEFMAEQEVAESDKPKEDGYFSEDTSKPAGGSASYWN